MNDKDRHRHDPKADESRRSSNSNTSDAGESGPGMSRAKKVDLGKGSHEQTQGGRSRQ